MDEQNEAAELLRQISARAKEIVRERLVKADTMSDSDLYQMNLSLPPQFKYQSVREIQTVLVKGAFDALGFSVELGLLSKTEATDYWQELHSEFARLWP